MRKVADCRLYPSESRCSLMITGTEDEVVLAAAEHAVSVHGHEDTAELREEVRAQLADEGPAGRYGTVMLATLSGSVEDLQRATQDWAEQRRVPGFLGEEVLLADDGATVVVPVFFEDEASYRRLASDPGQDQWWAEHMAPHLSDVRWIDGTWQHSLSRVPATAG
jgi:hypothetical protein